MIYALTFPILKFVSRLVFLYCGGYRSFGHGNVPLTGGVLICPNHASDADPCAIAVALPRPAYYMAKEHIFAMPVLGLLARIWRCFPVRRDTADVGALRRAESLLRAGEAVVIFPEGGGNAQNTLQPLYPGALLIALRTGVPIVPVALVNTGKQWTYGDTHPRRAGAPIRVTFGPPLRFDDLKGKRGAVDAATLRLTETLASMMNQPVPVGKPKQHGE